MRRHKKEIIEQNVIDNLLRSATVGRLGTKGKDGYPRIKPLNFACADHALYFHSAKEGEKIDDILRDSRVCFEVDLPIAYVKGSQEDPCNASYLYQSVIIYGKAALVHDKVERRKALSELMRKYQPGGGYGEFLDAKLAITAVVRIDIETMTGKEDLGTGVLRDNVLAGLQAGKPLPMEMQGDEG
jgi:nitroimidazol reductase NimA-like FMN-containing flavoprotein (pyridoxamine 5'-phosphate oxidase superfamily)